MAEAVADVLSRFAVGGVAMEINKIAPTSDGEGLPVGAVRVCGYLAVDGELEEKRQRLEKALWYLGRIRALPAPEFHPIQEVNWAEAWKELYQPLAIGRKLIVVPAWLEAPDEERIAVRIDPGMAFGTGAHPTTQLCLQFLDELIRPGAFEAVIDVGCGSGILSIAALKLGVRRALGVDIDTQAISAAKENAASNGVLDRLELETGSVEDIRSGAYSIRRAPFVLANILASVIVRLFSEGLGDLVEENGEMILSGILEEQEAGLLETIKQYGFLVHQRRQLGDWVALLLSR